MTTACRGGARGDDHVPGSEPAVTVMVEACVTGVEEAVAAERDGADRLEVCVSLDVGGLTPPSALVRAVIARTSLPVHALVRLRGDEGALRDDDADALLRDAHEVLGAGARGVVVGGLDPAGHVDAGLLEAFAPLARDVPVTFHRAFDRVADPRSALAALAEAGVARVLTAGGPGSAWEARVLLGGLVREASALRQRTGGEGPWILAGGRVRADHVLDLVAETGVAEVHARASAIPGIVAALGRA